MPSTRAYSVTAAAAFLLAVVPACRPTANQRSAVRIDHAPATRHAVIDGDIRTTDPGIAIGNLEAQIAQLERLAERNRLTVAQRAELVELIAAHGQYTGSVADHEHALAVAEDLAREFPADPVALLARARARSTFHRFAEALADVERAVELRASPAAVADRRAAIYQALGRYDEAVVIRRTSAERNPNAETLGGLASLEAQRGNLDAAARLFEEARWSYRDVSPFPLATLFLDEGAMWMGNGELERARALLTAALRRVPSYAAVRCHLAEVEAALGNVDRAAALLEPWARTADDPEAAALLARILMAVGRADEALPWRKTAERRYDELAAAYPEAYGPHAAELRLIVADTSPPFNSPAARYPPAARRLARVRW